MKKLLLLPMVLLSSISYGQLNSQVDMDLKVKGNLEVIHGDAYFTPLAGTNEPEDLIPIYLHVTKDFQLPYDDIDRGFYTMKVLPKIAITSSGGYYYSAQLGDKQNFWSGLYSSRIDMGSSLGRAKLNIYTSNDGTSSYGMGVTAGHFNFHLGNPLARYSFYDRLNGNEIFSIHGNGNVFVNGSTVHSSDRNKKHDIVPVSSADILQAVNKMEIYKWKYNGETTNHIGPMAQDFYSAFGVGFDNKTISAVDADGVSMAAIQALYAEIKVLQEEVWKLKNQ